MFSITAEQAQLAIESCQKDHCWERRQTGILILQGDLARKGILKVVRPSCEVDSYIPAVIPFVGGHFTAVLIKVTKAYDVDKERSTFACNFRYTSCCHSQERSLVCSAVQDVYDVFCKPSTGFAFEFKEKSVCPKLRNTANQPVDGALMMDTHEAQVKIVCRRPRKH
jgi:hypothetical protein